MGGRLTSAVLGGVVLLLLCDAGVVTAQLVARASYVDEGSFELPSAGSTSPHDPVGMAVSRDGSLHVLDRRGRVLVFDARGNPLRSYGEESLREGAGIAIDRDDVTFVLDRNQGVVQVFEPGGALWYTIGGARRDPARIRDGRGLALGPGGFVYVLDRSGPAVRIFGRDGAFIRALDLSGQFRDPTGITVDGDGSILLVSSRSPGTVFWLPTFFEVAWNADPTLQLLTFGGSGEPTAVASDGGGAVVFLDAGEGRVWGGSRIDPDGDLIRRPIYGGVGTGRGSFREPVDLAFTPERDLVILDRRLRKVERIGLAETERTASLELGWPLRVSQLPPDLDGVVLYVRVSDGSGEPRFLMGQGDARNLATVEPEESLFQDLYGQPFRAYQPPTDWAGAPVRFSLRNTPDAVAMNDTLLVVAEARQRRFSVFDLRDGSGLGEFGDEYRDDRRLSRPRGVALFPDGSVAVADHGNDRIAVFSRDLASLLGSIPFPRPEGVGVSPDGSLFAWDESGRSLVHLPVDGGPPEPVEGLLSDPVRSVTFDRTGNLFVLDESSRVTVIDRSRDRVLIRFGGLDPDFEASHVSVDGEGNVYVASLRRNRTRVYRWDAGLPGLADVRVELLPEGGRVSWTPWASPFLDGVAVSGSLSPEGPFRIVATAEGSEGAAELRSQVGEVHWVRAAPVSVTGVQVSPSEPLPLLHLNVREASGSGDRNRVLNYMRWLQEFTEDDRIRLSSAVARELAWHAFVSELHFELYEQAVAREAALEGWQGDDGGFTLHRLLADAHRRLGDPEGTFRNAERALELLPEAEQGGGAETELLGWAVSAGVEAGAYSQVIAFGERLRPRVTGEELYRVLSALTVARSGEREHGAALALARELVELELGGEASRPPDDPGGAFGAAFRSAMAGPDPGEAERWADLALLRMAGEPLSRLRLDLARFRLDQGRPAEARRQLLDLLAADVDPGLLEDPTSVELVFDVYRGLQRSDTVEYAAGLEFLDEYSDLLPEAVGGLRVMVADSLAVFRPREDTRAKLGRGFRLWEQANFVQVIPFFEDALGRGDLTPAQETLARGLLAGVYQDVGRTDAAEATVRAILTAAPDYDPHSANLVAEANWGITPFTPPVIELLERLREGYD